MALGVSKQQGPVSYGVHRDEKRKVLIYKFQNRKKRVGEVIVTCG